MTATTKRTQRRHTARTRRDALAAYVAGKEPVKAICARYSLPAVTLHRWAKQAGVLRTRSQASANQCRRRFGAVWARAADLASLLPQASTTDLAAILGTSTTPVTAALRAVRPRTSRDSYRARMWSPATPKGRARLARLRHVCRLRADGYVWKEVGAATGYDADHARRMARAHAEKVGYDWQTLRTRREVTVGGGGVVMEGER